MDGVDQLNNILIIGMTNRFDMIDEALLRPGRLEVHMEINLPDQTGRLQILKIHTHKMRSNGIMDGDVDLDELSGLTKNIKVGTMANYKDDISEMKVNRQDFMMALDEVRPAFGVSEEELDACVQGGLINYSESVEVPSHLASLKRRPFSGRENCMWNKYERVIELIS